MFEKALEAYPKSQARAITIIILHRVEKDATICFVSLRFWDEYFIMITSFHKKVI